MPNTTEQFDFDDDDQPLRRHDGVNRPMSLTSLVASHLSGEGDPSVMSASSNVVDAAAGNPPVLSPSSAFRSVVSPSGTLNPLNTYSAQGSQMAGSVTGQQLNAVDTEWAAGIEQLLPTKTFRLRVMKERMLRERVVMEKQLKQLQTINTETTRQQAKALRQKLFTLQRHEMQVDIQLQQMLQGSQPVGVYKVIGLTRHWWRIIRKVLFKGVDGLGIRSAIHRLDPARGEMYRLNERLTQLTRLTEQRLTTASANELADVMTAYDDVVARLNELQATMPTTLLGQWQRLFSRIF
jgi:hypothetical protein